jgi:hypothetical protein
LPEDYNNHPIGNFQISRNVMILDEPSLQELKLLHAITELLKIITVQITEKSD